MTRSSSPEHEHAGEFLRMIGYFHVASEFSHESEIPASLGVQTLPRPGDSERNNIPGEKKILVAR